HRTGHKSIHRIRFFLWNKKKTDSKENSEKDNLKHQTVITQGEEKVFRNDIYQRLKRRNFLYFLSLLDSITHTGIFQFTSGKITDFLSSFKEFRILKIIDSIFDFMSFCRCPNFIT